MSYKNKKILQSVIAIILAAAFVFKMDICLWKVDSRAEVNRELCL